MINVCLNQKIKNTIELNEFKIKEFNDMAFPSIWRTEITRLIMLHLFKVNNNLATFTCLKSKIQILEKGVKYLIFID